MHALHPWLMSSTHKTLKVHTRVTSVLGGGAWALGLPSLLGDAGRAVGVTGITGSSRGSATCTMPCGYIPNLIACALNCQVQHLSQRCVSIRNDMRVSTAHGVLCMSIAWTSIKYEIASLTSSPGCGTTLRMTGSIAGAVMCTAPPNGSRPEPAVACKWEGCSVELAQMRGAREHSCSQVLVNAIGNLMREPVVRKRQGLVSTQTT